MKTIVLTLFALLTFSLRSQSQHFVKAVQVGKCDIAYACLTNPQQESSECEHMQQDQGLLDKIQKETEDIILSKFSPFIHLAQKIKMKIESQKMKEEEGKSGEIIQGMF